MLHGLAVASAARRLHSTLLGPLSLILACKQLINKKGKAELSLKTVLFLSNSRDLLTWFCKSSVCFFEGITSLFFSFLGS